MKNKLEKQNDACYRRWDKTEWWEGGYEDLWSRQEEANAENAREPTGADQTRSYCEKDKVIYLTADAENEVDELKEGETYIIGGIVDHNRYKVHNFELAFLQATVLMSSYYLFRIFARRKLLTVVFVLLACRLENILTALRRAKS